MSLRRSAALAGDTKSSQSLHGSDLLISEAQTLLRGWLCLEDAGISRAPLPYANGKC